MAINMASGSALRASTGLGILLLSLLAGRVNSQTYLYSRRSVTTFATMVPTGPANLVLDSNTGIMYGAMTQRDPAIVKIYPNGTDISVAGNAGFGGLMDGGFTHARFGDIRAITIDDSGSTPLLYFFDLQFHRIRKLDLGTEQITTIAGTGGTGSVDGDGLTQAQFNKMYDMDYYSGSIYGVTKEGMRLRKMVVSTSEVTTLIGASGTGDVDGPGATAQLYKPVGIVTDTVNNRLYIADQNNHKIRKFELGTQEVTTIAGTGSGAEVDGALATAQLTSPIGISYSRGIYDDLEFLVVSCEGSHTLRVIDLTINEIFTIGGAANSPGAVDGEATETRFNSPAGLVTNAAFTYVADFSNKMIRMIDPLVTRSPTMAPTPIFPDKTAVLDALLMQYSGAFQRCVHHSEENVERGYGRCPRYLEDRTLV